MAERHQVLVGGGGFGGLSAAKALAHADVIDRTNHHLFQPLLYQVATGILSEGVIAPPLRRTDHHRRTGPRRTHPSREGRDPDEPNRPLSKRA